MKNKNLLTNTLFGGCIFFLLFILISLIFQKVPPFDNDRSLADIVIEALVVAIIFSAVMFLFSRRRLRNRESHRH